MSNGFDPYGGQMILMPYPTSANCQIPPFNANPYEFYDPTQDESAAITTPKTDEEIQADDLNNETETDAQETQPIQSTAISTKASGVTECDDRGVDIEVQKQPDSFVIDGSEMKMKNDVNEV